MASSYNPSQPRVPEGNQNGGRWTKSGVSSGGAVPTGTRAGAIGRSSTDYPPKNALGKNTQMRFSDGKGNYTPEREALHEEIVARYIVGTTPVRNKVVTLVAGGPSSGKSSAKEGLTFENTVMVDADQIRKFLPEYQEQVGLNKKIAEFTHEEASDIAQKIVAAAGKNNRNLMIDGVGNGTFEKMVDRVAKLRADDYQIEARYTVLEPERARARMIKRAETPGEDFGRYVPEDYLMDAHKGIANGLPKLIATGGFDKIEVFDNNKEPPLGLSASETKAWVKANPPKLIFKGGRYPSTHDVVDPEAWENFKRSGQ